MRVFGINVNPDENPYDLIGLIFHGLVEDHQVFGRRWTRKTQVVRADIFVSAF